MVNFISIFFYFTTFPPFVLTSRMLEKRNLRTYLTVARQCCICTLLEPQPPVPTPAKSAIKMQNVQQNLLKGRKYNEGCRPCTGFIEWYMKRKCCFYNAMYLFVCRDQHKNTCFNNHLLD
jgi:hypothetical protein